MTTAGTAKASTVELNRIAAGPSDGTAARYRLILCLHDLSPEPVGVGSERNYWMAFDQFSALYAKLEENALHAGIELEITSDDGFISDYAQLFPWLLERGLGATFFIPTAHLGKPGRMSPHHLREMRRFGMRIGSHGHDHIDLTAASPAALRYDVDQGHQRLGEIMGEPIRVMAPPYGACNRNVSQLLGEYGYDEIHLCRGGVATPGARMLNRVALEPNPPAIDRLVRFSNGPNCHDRVRAMLHLAQARFDPRAARTAA